MFARHIDELEKLIKATESKLGRDREYVKENLAKWAPETPEANYAGIIMDSLELITILTKMEKGLSITAAERQRVMRIQALASDSNVANYAYIIQPQPNLNAYFSAAPIKPQVASQLPAPAPKSKCSIQ